MFIFPNIYTHTQNMIYKELNLIEINTKCNLTYTKPYISKLTFANSGDDKKLPY